MNEKAKKYLLDIKMALDNIQLFLIGVPSFMIYEKDLKTKSAVERQLGIIGEAVNQLKKLNPELNIENAVQIIGLRNRLIHAYDSTEDTMVWAIIKNHLPKLKIEIDNFFKI